MELLEFCLVFLFSEAAAVLDLDGAVGPDFHWEDKVVGGNGVFEVAFAGYELVEVFDEHFGNFDLGFAHGGVEDGQSPVIVPCRDEAFAQGLGKNGESRAGVSIGEMHGSSSV